MFSDELHAVMDRATGIGSLPAIDEAETRGLIERAASGEVLADEEVIALVNGLDRPANARLVLDFARQYRRPHDREVLLLPPLYFSSICENRCLYCNFSRGGGIRLTLDEFADEVDTLISLGYRSIELVSSQDPELYRKHQPFDVEDQHFDVAPVRPYFDLLRERLAGNGGGMITSNIPPLCSDGLRQLKDAGLDCYLAWMETLHPEQYHRLHAGERPKGSQHFRVDSYERALEEGIDHVAGAFLKGLYDWRREEVVLYALDRHLKHRFGHGFSIIGSPRVKGEFTESRLIEGHLVTDSDYALNIALDRVLFDGVLWLQTRESFDFNRELIRDFGAGVILTLTSSTAPGGYSRPASAEAQFPVYKQDLERAAARLAEDGLEVLFEWRSADLSAFQRVNGTG